MSSEVTRMEEKYLKVVEVAEILHVRIETVRRYIQQGAIVAIALPGGDYRIAESELAKITQPKEPVKETTS